MSEKSVFSALGGSGEQLAEPEPSFLTLTPRTIRLGHGSEVFQLSNVTRIGKYKVLEKQFPALIIAIALIAGLAFLVTTGAVSKLVGVALLLVAGYGLWSRMQPKTFAFGIEASSGTTRYLYTKDEAFIGKMVEVVTKYMEAEQSGGVTINIQDRSITNMPGGVITGGANTGDKL